MSANQRLWWYGLIGGFIGGAAGSIDSGLALMILNPESFNLNEKFQHTILTVFVLGLLVGTKTAFAYLAKSPLPPEANEESFWAGKD